jgi:membrane fusion protein (multidrug efflux system)
VTRAARFLFPMLGLAMTGLLGCGGAESGADSKDERVPVRVQPVERRDLVRKVLLSGRLVANAVVEVYPKLTGRIVRFHRREGDTVEAGQVLVELDATELSLELQRAKAVLAQARARRDEARRRHARGVELHEKNILSKANLDTAQADKDIAKADYQTAIANRDLAAQRVADTKIVAPIGGILQDRNHSVGDYAGPALGGARTGAIFTIIQADPLLLEVSVPEEDAPRVRARGEAISIMIDAFPGEEFIGVVDYVAPSLHPVSFTQAFRMRLPNPDGRLKPGLYARIESIQEIAEGALVVPADALVDLGDSTGVYVVDDGHARLRAVKTLFTAGNAAAVATGLQEGDSVIVEGKSSVREGTEVRLVFAGPQSGT